MKVSLIKNHSEIRPSEKRAYTGTTPMPRDLVSPLVKGTASQSKENNFVDGKSEFSGDSDTLSDFENNMSQSCNKEKEEGSGYDIGAAIQ
jgi:hypothetical protein